MPSSTSRREASADVADVGADPSGPQRIVLASASPRRARLLREAGLAFDVRPVDVDETPPVSDPRSAVLALARRKADAAAREGTTGLVLAADTLVFLDGEPLGKPASAEDAGQTLRRLSGRAHEVWTGVVVHRATDGARFEDAACSRVVFRRLGEGEVRDYVESGEPTGKAGAYAIQGRAAAFVERLEGGVDTVIGLPVALTLELLRAAGLRR